MRNVIPSCKPAQGGTCWPGCAVGEGLERNEGTERFYRWVERFLKWSWTCLEASEDGWGLGGCATRALSMWGLQRSGLTGTCPRLCCRSPNRMIWRRGCGIGPQDRPRVIRISRSLRWKKADIARNLISFVTRFELRMTLRLCFFGEGLQCSILAPQLWALLLF